MAIYMKFGDIEGDVTETGHPLWVELESLDFGVGRGISSSVGSSADRESTAPSVSEVVVSKQNDVSTGKLMQEALSGHGKLVKIDFTRTYKNQQEVYIALELTNTIISSYQHKATGGGRPTETVSLNFTKVQFTTKQMPADGTLGDPDHVTFDLADARTT